MGSSSRAGTPGRRQRVIAGRTNQSQQQQSPASSQSQAARRRRQAGPATANGGGSGGPASGSGSGRGHRGGEGSSRRPSARRARAAGIKTDAAGASGEGAMYFQGDPRQKIPFKECTALRNHRADVVRIRKMLQDYVATKFGSTRALYASLDMDKDGVISMDDWLQGLKYHHFPITEAEARKMFTAIDIDSDNGLTYSEMVRVVEPRSFTSFTNGLLSEDDLGRLAGFQEFTPAQVANFVADDKEGEIGGGFGEVPLTPPSERALKEEEEAAIVDKYKRRGLSRNEEIHHLKSRIQWQLDQAQEAGGKRFMALFRDFDTYQRGYLTNHQFRQLLGEKGLDLSLSKRQQNLLIEEVADGRGATEAGSFYRFLSREYMPEPDELDESKRRTVLILHHRTKHMEKPKPEQETNPPPAVVTPRQFTVTGATSPRQLQRPKTADGTKKGSRTARSSQSLQSMRSGSRSTGRLPRPQSSASTRSRRSLGSHTGAHSAADITALGGTWWGAQHTSAPPTGAPPSLMSSGAEARSKRIFVPYRRPDASGVHVAKRGLGDTGIALNATVTAAQRAGSQYLSNTSALTHPDDFVPSPLLPTDSVLFGAPIAVDSDGDGFVTPRSGSTTRGFCRTQTGLSATAFNVIKEVEVGNLPQHPQARFSRPKNVTQNWAKAHSKSAMFASPRTQWRRDVDKITDEDRAREKNRLAAKHARVQVQKKWMRHCQDEAQAAMMAADRRRVCHRSKQQLRYMKAILYDGNLPPPPQGQTMG